MFIINILQIAIVFSNINLIKHFAKLIMMILSTQLQRYTSETISRHMAHNFLTLIYTEFLLIIQYVFLEYRNVIHYLKFIIIVSEAVDF